MTMAKKILGAALGEEESKLYVDDVFSTYPYAGNGSTQTINNGIDLAGKGGLVWIKNRTVQPADHTLVDTVRDRAHYLRTNSTAADAVEASDKAVTSFNSNGFSLGGEAAASYLSTNQGTGNFVCWTFRKAPKFFDVVTYTGDGINGRLIPHSLGTDAGMILVKRLDKTSNWIVRHRGNGVVAPRLALNLTVPDSGAGSIENGFIGLNNASDFAVWEGSTNISAVNSAGASYVAYLFAHDASADGIIQCGSFTTDSGGKATVTLGWEPQYVLFKNSGGTGDWFVNDVMRGMPVGVTGTLSLSANTSASEASGSYLNVTNTGFFGNNLAASQTYIYLAIRRPNKPPKTGTEVFTSDAFTSSGTGTITRTIEFPSDFSIEKSRSNGSNWISGNRLTAWNKAALFTSQTSAESDYSTLEGVVGQAANQNSYTFKKNYAAATPYLNYMFRRAPGFFDVVCYTGNGLDSRNIAHSLGATPGMIIVKKTSGHSNWSVWHTVTGSGSLMLLNSAAPKSYSNVCSSLGATYSGRIDLATATVFRVRTTDINTGVDDTGENVNQSGNNYVAYLFASLPGISKAGGYIGNGSSQTIDCGFTTGARFILIKRVDATGNWYVWDSARGIVAANDPCLSLNTLTAEMTTNDSVDPDTSGFIVNQDTATNINVNGSQYIFLAIA